MSTGGDGMTGSKVEGRRSEGPQVAGHGRQESSAEEPRIDGPGMNAGSGQALETFRPCDLRTFRPSTPSAHPVLAALEVDDQEQRREDEEREDGEVDQRVQRELVAVGR